MTPFPWNLGLNAPIPNRKDERFTFSHAERCAVGIADLLVLHVFGIQIIALIILHVHVVAKTC